MHPTSRESELYVLADHNPRDIDITKYCQLTVTADGVEVQVIVVLLEITGNLLSHLKMAKAEIVNAIDNSKSTFEAEFDTLINSVIQPSYVVDSKEESKVEESQKHKEDVTTPDTTHQEVKTSEKEDVSENDVTNFISSNSTLSYTNPSIF